MESDKAKDPMEGLEYVMYPSKDQLLAGQAQEPEQRMGDYVMMKSQHETGRVFSPIADLGVEGGVAPGSQVRTCEHSTNPPARNTLLRNGGSDLKKRNSSL